MVRAIALLLTTITGFAGLVYEVAWQKYLATLLGSHGEATAAVLAIFLGGLSLGYALFGTWTQRWVRTAEQAGRTAPLLRRYGIVEAAIGLYAFAFPFLFGLVQAVSSWIPAANPALSFAFDVVLAAVLIGPPSVLMGGTIPILTQALARDLEDATRFHALVYALNTAGAFAGALAAGFWLVPQLGLVGVLETVGWLNVVAGSVFIALGRPTAGSRAAQTAGTGAVQGFAVYAAVALGIGFAMMTVQTVLIRIGGLSLGSSHFTFAMVVAVFVLCIALGSIAVSALNRISPLAIVANLWVLVALLIALYPLLEEGPYWAHVVRSVFRDNPAGFYPFYANVFVALLCVTGLPVMLSGAALPLLFHHLRGQFGDLGGTAGRLYSWNTVGSLFGALLGGYLLFFWFDLHSVYRIAVGVAALSAALLSVRVLQGARAVGAAALALPVAVLLFVLPDWDPSYLSSGTFRYRKPAASTYAGADAYFEQGFDAEVIFSQDDPAVSVAVVDHPVGSETSRAILTNGKPDGSIIVDYPTMALAALVPAAVVDRLESAFVIGYGTGVTVGEMAALDSVGRVVVAEISSGVIEAAPLFDEFNQNASRNPKVSIVQGDAYRTLQRSPERFDVIASEPSNPWMSGVEMLFSREFLQAARARLNPGGVYLQWFHAYETDDATVELVLATFSSVFDGVAVWYAIGNDFLLLGFAQGGGVELDRIVERMQRPDIARGMARAGVGSVAELVAHELLPAGIVGSLDLGGELHSLLHPRLSDRAARAFYRGGVGDLPPHAHSRVARLGAQRSLLGQLERRHGGRLRPRALERLAEETCDHRPRECAVILARWLKDDPGNPVANELLRRTRQQPGTGSALSRATIGSLRVLFGEPRAHNRPTSVALAHSVTDLFERFYFHAAPFDRNALRQIWESCESRPPDRCRDGHEQAKLRLGEFGEIGGRDNVSASTAARPGPRSR
jgi:spermidine synthase